MEILVSEEIYTRSRFSSGAGDVPAQPLPRCPARASASTTRAGEAALTRGVLLPSFIALTLGLCVCASAPAQDFAGFLRSAGLLTPRVGWASTDTHLFRTTNAGLDWNDITPNAGKSKTIADIFFLDSSNGWVVFAEAFEDNKGTDSARFEIASTTDGGANWSVAPLNVPEFDPGRGMSSYACVDFADTQHGWVMLRMNGSTAVSIGILLMTADGGRTWTLLGPPVAGAILFTDPKRGWLAGGPDDKLYATSDGGQHWHEVSLAVPPPLDASAQPTYYLPIFPTADQAFLPVAFFEPDGEKRSLALFRSNDGGRTWAPNGVLRIEGTAWASATTVVDSSWITAVVSHGSATLRTVPVAGKISGAVTPAKVNAGPTDSGLGEIEAITFADGTRGWALLASGELLSTTSGGAAWTDITPPAAKSIRPRMTPGKAPAAAASYTRGRSCVGRTSYIMSYGIQGVSGDDLATGV